MSKNKSTTKEMRLLSEAMTVRLALSAKDIPVRKEVIQPQVPLRLPCYDFTPITPHTFGTCPPCGLAQRLRVHAAFVV
jgi:hypothetical protein